MSKFLKFLNSGKYVILTITFVGALIGFLYSYRIYQGKNYYEQTFSFVSGEKLVDPNDFFDEAIIKKTQKLEKSYFTGSTITKYKYIDIDSSNMKVNFSDGIYTIKVYGNAVTSSEVSKTVVKGFIQHLAIFALDDKYWDSDQILTGTNKNGEYTYHSICYDVFDYDSSKISEYSDKNAKNLIPAATICSASVALALSFVFIGVLGYKYPKILNKKVDYDNDALFKTPFHKNYWKDASKSLKEVRNLVLISILLSMVMVAKFITLPSGFGNLGISFSYLFLSISSMLFGPIAALLTGFLSDTIGFIIKPSGVFFPGYTLSAMIACFIYAMFFYKTKINFTKCLLARVFVNFGVNVLLGSLWYKMYASLSFDAMYDYMLFISLPKNIAYLLPQSIVLFIVLRVAVPIFNRAGYLDDEINENVSLF